jgi:hypothetical protein
MCKSLHIDNLPALSQHTRVLSREGSSARSRHFDLLSASLPDSELVLDPAF